MRTCKGRSATLRSTGKAPSCRGQLLVRLRAALGKEAHRGKSWRGRASPDQSATSVVVEEDNETPSSSSTSSLGEDAGATYFNQEHEFRIDFDHLVQLSVDFDDEDDDEYSDFEIDTMKCNVGREALNNWITNPKLLLIASYGEDNVHETVSGDQNEKIFFVTLPKVKIFSWTVVPSFDISATVEQNGVVFTSDSIRLDGTGIPDSLRSTKIAFSLYSHLYVEEQEEEQGLQGNGMGSVSTMVAQNALRLGVYLPKLASRLPGVKRTGNIIVRTILNSVDRSAKNKLMKSFQDYIKSNV